MKLVLSFRFKIQLAVLLLLTITLAIYITLASKTLRSEKTAGVMSNLALDSEMIAGRIAKRISGINTWIAGNLQSSDIRSFDEKKELLAVYEMRESHSLLVYSREVGFRDLEVPTATDVLQFALFGRGADQIWILSPKKNGVAFASLWSRDIFLKDLSNSPESTIYLADVGGGSLQEISSSGVELSKTEAASLVSNLVANSTTVKWMSISERSVIFASSPIEQTNASIVLTYPERLVLAPVRALLYQSILFGMFVFGLTGILALWVGRTLTNKLEILKNVTRKIAGGDLESEPDIQSNDEIGELSRSIAAMVRSLREYIARVAEKSRMETELKTARAVQESLFPSESWSDGEYMLTGYYESASECGGDFWYYWQNKSHLFFIIADTTGHGAPAALITSAARATIANTSKLGDGSLVQIVQMLDNAIFECSKGKLMMTAIVGSLDPSTGDIAYINCSHESPYVLGRGERGFAIIDDNPALRLGDPGSSTIRKSAVEARFRLEPGETFFISTDGLIEIKNSKGIMISQRKLAIYIVEIFRKTNLSLEGQLDMIAKWAHEFSAVPLQDDLTMLALRRSQSKRQAP